MIFYGSKATKLKDGTLNNIKCPNCEDGRTMHYAIFGKYAYLYWIPMFPIGKENILECASCKKTYKLKTLPNQVREKFNLEKADVKYPIWYFSGLAVLAVIIAFLMYSGKQNAENEKRYIEDPAVGDVYALETPQKGYYSTMKINKVTADSIFVIYNDVSIDKKSKTYKLDKPENYTTEFDGYSKAEIKSLFAKKTIYDVDRD
ncbi:hypothetical protein [Olleya sp. HaHaR_3_96]|uniref:hypothetical protein n=1 Tax=Olleya sp. HaHaR_3_96 TaxID=2745560 RepID=UPI001C4F9322|nr:hypothetical protein [Olleya sp. HaHaR_3_96]QXP60004.1 hypothetical protein H0I26_19195 [Olleya sp. HaHaR_3_96]